MIGSPCCLEADHDEIVELSSSSRRKEGLPPGHRGGRGEQPVHPRGGGGTPSPLVGWAGGRWPVGAQTSRGKSTGCLCSARRANRATNTEAADGSVRGGSGPRTSAANADGQARSGWECSRSHLPPSLLFGTRCGTSKDGHGPADHLPVVGPTSAPRRRRVSCPCQNRP